MKLSVSLYIGLCLVLAAIDASAQAASTGSAARLGFAHLHRPHVGPGEFKYQPSYAALSGNRHALNAAPSSDLASLLANAQLPARSGKIYTMPPAIRTSLLTPRHFNFAELHEVNATAIKRVDLNDHRHPDLDFNQH